MNALLTLPADLTRARGLTLLLTANQSRSSMTELIAAQILHGPLFVMAGSEWLPAFELTRMIRRQTLRVKETLSHLYTARASTCYRLFDSLANLPLKGEPILVIDFLHTFYDADIPLRARFFKLRQCCRELKRLAFYRPVVVTTQELAIEDHEKFIPVLCSIADRTFTLETEQKTIQQPALL